MIVARAGTPVAGPDPIRPFWSITKAAIAACALRLAGRGEVALDADPGQGRTLRRLLGHRAGIGDYGGMPDYHAAVAAGASPWSRAELFARLPAPAPAPAKAGWAYSNPGYLLAREVLERATGRDIATLLHQEILAPLGLGRTRLAARREVAWLAYDFGWAFPGTLIGPVSEAAALMAGILDGPLLDMAARAEMRDAHPLGGPIPGRPWGTTGYGLGLMIGTTRDGIAMTGHSGAGPGGCCAVYQVGDGGPVVAAFSDDATEASAEWAVVAAV